MPSEKFYKGDRIQIIHTPPAGRASMIEVNGVKYRSVPVITLSGDVSIQQFCAQPVFTLYIPEGVNPPITVTPNPVNGVYTISRSISAGTFDRPELARRFRIDYDAQVFKLISLRGALEVYISGSWVDYTATCSMTIGTNSAFANASFHFNPSFSGSSQRYSLYATLRVAGS